MEITAPIKLRNRGDYPGDQLIQEISAASILAKVARDEEMILLDEQYPEYGLKSIKSYPTKAHIAAIEKYGASCIIKPLGRLGVSLNTCLTRKVTRPCA